MKSFQNEFKATWLLLIIATLVSVAIIERLTDVTIAVPIVLLIALFKVRLVFLNFMELRRAPLSLRLIFECWGILVTSIIYGGYLIAY